MNRNLKFPIYQNSDVFLFEEIFFELLTYTEKSTEKCLKICRELQKIVLSLFEKSSLIIVIKSDKIKVAINSESLESNFNFFKVTEDDDNLIFKFIGFCLPQSGLEKFQKRQTLRQRTDYVNELNSYLNERNLKISKLVKAKTYLMNFIAHEVRNPLNTMIGYSNILREDPDAIPAEETAEIFYRQTHDIKRLVDEILDFSKLEMNKLQVNNQEVSIYGFAQGFALDSAVLVKAKKLNWEFHICENICEKSFISADAFRLKQILNNFLSNALKFTKTGTISFEVSTDINDIATFTIHDTGQGFDPTFKKNIFGEFSQESTEITKEFGGSGLGLHISFGLAKLMKASVDAQSTLGKGASFMIKFPFTKKYKQHIIGDITIE